MNVLELINELMKVKDKSKPVYFFDDGDIFPIVGTDDTISDRLDLDTWVEE